MNPIRLIHLSDLHRTGNDPFTNAELITGIRMDLHQMKDLGDDFTSPDAIVVTGDLVQGVGLHETDRLLAQKKQNDEALDFLNEIADTFVGGDRSRVVILPGNHDIDRYTAKLGMQKVDDSAYPKDLNRELSDPNSKFRWCWKERCLFQISDATQYDKKMDGFREVASMFYKNARLRMEYIPNRSWNHFQVADSAIITAFDNCQSIDGYRFSASIRSHDIAEATRALDKCGVRPKLKIAAWHHNFNGPPLKQDYLDSDDLRFMLNCGYRIGLHGHQHLPDAVPYSLHTSSDHIMSILSVGSLGASDSDVVPGCKQQFSVIELRPLESKGRVWIREMISRAVFGPGRIRNRTHEIYCEFQWTPAVDVPIVRTNNHGGPPVLAADRIEGMLAQGHPEEALQLIESNEKELGSYGRLLKLRALQMLEQWDAIVQAATMPKGPEEVTFVVKAMVKLGACVDAEKQITSAIGDGHLEPQYGSQLIAWVKREALLQK